MKKIYPLLSILCLIYLMTAAAAYAADATEANPLESLKTPAEISNWTRTTSSEEVLDFVEQVALHSNGRARLEYLAWTAKGNLLPMLIIGTPAPSSPEEVPNDKAIAFINCNIHSGEIEGKESMLMFAREAALGKHDDLLKDLVILLCPNMSPDGNDDLGTWRRSTQFTPDLVGTRYNGQGLNMNRDMTKLDAYEARAVVEVMNKWDPVIFIDAHATNGSYMRHAVTYNWGLHPNTDPELMAYNRDEFSRMAIGADSYLYKTQGKKAIPYGNFGKNYSGLVAEGWYTFEDYPRYTTNYAGLRNRLAMLLEVYSYDDYKTRVDTQYACIYGILQTVAAEKDKIKKLIAEADARENARLENGVAADDIVCLQSELQMLDEVDGGYVDVDSYLENEEGKVAPIETDYDNEGFKTAIRFEAEKTHHIPYYGKFVPTEEEKLGAIYILRPGADEAVELLLRHGIKVQKLTTSITLQDYKWFKITTMGTSPTLYEGHYMNDVQGEWVSPDALTTEDKELTVPSGSYIVSTAQTHGSLAALLLEPESTDGLVSWNFLDHLIKTEGAGSDPFVSTDTNTNSKVVMPMWKLEDYSLLTSGNAQLEDVDTLARDETLPAPVEPLNPYNGESRSGGGGGGCNASGAAMIYVLVLGGGAILLKRRFF